MIEKLDALLAEVSSFNAAEKEEIEKFRIRFSGKKGILNELFDQFKQVPNDQKQDISQKINTLEQAVAAKIETLKNATSVSEVVEIEDLTNPLFPLTLGSRQTISLVKNRITEIFKSIGFAVADGPEIEDDW